MSVSTLEIEATDVSGQKSYRIANIPPEESVAGLLRSLEAEMKLASNDVSGRPISYQALLEREGRHLHAAERVSDALETGDRIVLQPNIDAGAGVRP